LLVGEHSERAGGDRAAACRFAVSARDEIPQDAASPLGDLHSAASSFFASL
jgi:hypothetical protein